MTGRSVNLAPSLAGAFRAIIIKGTEKVSTQACTTSLYIMSLEMGDHLPSVALTPPDLRTEGINGRFKNVRGVTDRSIVVVYCFP
jgi:hypothetical protein